MNTRASVYYGWTFFTLCGAGGYYFAKRSVNADRYERQRRETELMQQRNRQIAAGTRVPQAFSAEAAKPEKSSAPSIRSLPPLSPPEETTGDAGNIKGQGGREEDAAPAPPPQQPVSKYESQTPFRSKKGDRFV